MKDYLSMTKEELLAEKQSLEAQYKAYKDAGLSLDMSRGKPSADQLALAMPMLDVVDSKSVMENMAGLDTRNYGGLDGIVEAKHLMADLMEVDPSHVIVYGNSSLNVMYDTVCRAVALGIMGSTPWGKLDEVKFLCPVPGYDRHFAITEHFGIKMINIPMTESGPDMDMVEEYVNNDPTVKGIWCVPKYSNPEGVVYSTETVMRFANLKPAAADFRIFWDNAYAVHHLYDGTEPAEIPDIIEECAKAGNPDMVFVFASTSKISFAGGGIAALASSEANLADIKKSLTIQTISFDKINQLRHARFFVDKAGVMEHMHKHADLLRPRFAIVLDALERDIAGTGAGSWLTPHGGYFITYKAMPGCATRVIALAKEAGVVMTGAGAPFPYHKDPEDSIIRIAPSYPTCEDLKKAADIFTVCARLAAVEKLLEA